jgi:hypothetical protein
VCAVALRDCWSAAGACRYAAGRREVEYHVIDAFAGTGPAGGRPMTATVFKLCAFVAGALPAGIAGRVVVQGLELRLGLLQRRAVARSWSHPGSWDCTVRHQRCVTDVQVATVRRLNQACTKAPNVC